VQPQPNFQAPTVAFPSLPIPFQKAVSHYDISLFQYSQQPSQILRCGSQKLAATSAKTAFDATIAKQPKDAKEEYSLQEESVEPKRAKKNKIAESGRIWQERVRQPPRTDGRESEEGSGNHSS
jgi:hypothetical protein